MWSLFDPVEVSGSKAYCYYYYEKVKIDTPMRRNRFIHLKKDFNMQKNQSYLLTLILSLVITSPYPVFANHPNNGAAPTETTAKQTHPTIDAEALAWLMVIDKHEIELGKLALAEQVVPAVKEYAELMIKDHTENLQQTEKLASQLNEKPKMTTAVKNLKASGNKEMKVLKKLKGKEFEKAYISAMVNGHTEAVQVLTKYISNIGPNTELSEHLSMTKQHVEHHLEQAKEIQASL